MTLPCHAKKKNNRAISHNGNHPGMHASHLKPVQQCPLDPP